MTQPLAFLLLLAVLHPWPALPMFDTLYLAEKLQGMSLGEAYTFMAGYHSSPRPVRMVELWLAAKWWGGSAWGYGIANLVGGSGICWASAQIAERLTGSSGRGWVVGLLMALSYPMMYALLHYPFGVNVALGLAGLALVLSAREWPGRVCLILAAFGHDVLWALVAIGFLHEVVSDYRRRQAARRYATP